MKVFGRATVSSFLNDFIVYRNLEPVDRRLAMLSTLRVMAGLSPGRIPRKNEREYAAVISQLLRQARRLEIPKGEIKRLIYVGDTRLNDGIAFANLCREGGWAGVAFIGAETRDPPEVEVTQTIGGYPVYMANRWSALADFELYCAAEGFPVDETTAVVIDLDKTALGARGRNDHVIDRVRRQAGRDTVAQLLGEAFEASIFNHAYRELNQTVYHSFTTDNQDYLAYICLVLASGLMNLDWLLSQLHSGQLETFKQFMDEVEARSRELPARLGDLHGELYSLVQAGDPTPFKAFRRREYIATISRMAHLADGTPVEKMLESEIVLTQEVRLVAQDWMDRGALLFGLSDKPDEASLPTPAQEAQGYLPIHQTETHVVGDRI